MTTSTLTAERSSAAGKAGAKTSLKSAAGRRRGSKATKRTSGSKGQTLTITINSDKELGGMIDFIAEAVADGIRSAINGAAGSMTIDFESSKSASSRPKSRRASSRSAAGRSPISAKPTSRQVINSIHSRTKRKDDSITRADAAAFVNWLSEKLQTMRTSASMEYSLSREENNQFGSIIDIVMPAEGIKPKAHDMIEKYLLDWTSDEGGITFIKNTDGRIMIRLVLS